MHRTTESLSSSVDITQWLELMLTIYLHHHDCVHRLFHVINKHCHAAGLFTLKDGIVGYKDSEKAIQQSYFDITDTDSIKLSAVSYEYIEMGVVT
jgi:hypothetical protein